MNRMQEAPIVCSPHPAPLGIRDPPALLTPAARRAREFPRWALIAVGAGWFLCLLSQWVDWTLLEIAYAFGLLASLVATIVVATWAEDRLYTALVGRHGMLRLLVGGGTPLVGLIVVLPAAAVIGGLFEKVGGDTVAVCLILGALWFCSASVGSLVIVVIDVIISALVGGFRARVQWAVMGLLGLTTGVAVSVYAVARFLASRLPEVDASRLPETINRLIHQRGSAPEEVNIAIDAGDAQRVSEFLGRSEIQDLLAIAVFAGVALLSFPAVLSAAGKLAEAVMERLHPLTLGFERMASGDLQVRVEEKGSRDFVRISQGFNRMTSSLADAMSQLDARNRDLVEVNRAAQRFVPFSFLHLLGKESIRQVVRGDHVALTITVLFADIRGFTTFAEEKGAEETFGFINRYLAVMEPEIHARNGFINDFFGDGIMALFDDDADGAVAAAVGMLRALEGFNTALREEGAEPIRIGIGLHTGTLMLGTIGGRDRLDCTVIGDPANLASRVEGMTKVYGACVLVTESTVAALRRPEAVEVREIDRVRAKGKKEAITILEVLGIEAAADEKRRTRRTFSQALVAYRGGDFGTASALFERCCRDAPNDHASTLYVERCTQLLRGAPPDWDGITSLANK